jgi:hypothetical protein
MLLAREIEAFDDALLQAVVDVFPEEELARMTAEQVAERIKQEGVEHKLTLASRGTTGAAPGARRPASMCNALPHAHLCRLQRLSASSARTNEPSGRPTLATARPVSPLALPFLSQLAPPSKLLK